MKLLSEPKAIYNEIANLAPWHVTMSKITFQAGLNQISFWFFTEAIAKVGRANIQKGEVEKIDGWYVPKITTSLASLEKTFTETF